VRAFFTLQTLKLRPGHHILAGSQLPFVVGRITVQMRCKILEFVNHLSITEMLCAVVEPVDIFIWSAIYCFTKVRRKYASKASRTFKIVA
jgi:hypothetical protein